MNKVNVYPWIFAVVFGVVGVMVCALMGSYYENLASNAIWTRPPYIGGWHPNDVANLFGNIGFISFTTIIAMCFSFIPWEIEEDGIKREEGMPLLFAFLFGFIGSVFIWTLIILAITGLPLNGISFSSLLGVISGATISGVNKKSIRFSIIVSGIFWAIIGGIFYNNGFIVSLPIVLAFTSIGYTIGVPLKEKVERRVEIKRREELERKWRIREEERRRLEYERRIKEVKAKYEQYKQEGYKPDSDLDEMLK